MAKIPRSIVISFRLTEDQFESLKAEFKRNPCVNMRTPQRLARKFVIDAVTGRMVYKNPADRKEDTTLPTAEPKAKTGAKRKVSVTA